jgi:hypothetical protein
VRVSIIPGRHDVPRASKRRAGPPARGCGSESIEKGPKQLENLEKNSKTRTKTDVEFLKKMLKT